MFQITEILKKVPFFQTLGRDGLNFIVERLKFKPMEGDEAVCRAGDPGDKMYIIINGIVNVVVVPEQGGEQKVVAQLKGGDYFGEMSLLTGEPRSASVITNGAVEMFILEKSDFDVIIEKYPSIVLSMGKIMSQRLKDTNQKVASGPPADASLKGDLSEKKIADVMKFCEANSLNGQVLIRHHDENGEFHYHKGELQKVVLGDLTEAEALDKMLNWQSGSFVIEPKAMQMQDIKAEKPVAPQPVHRLVIVNNSMVVQKLLQRTFDSMGYEVYAVESAGKALNMVRSMGPSVVISDTKLPDGSGVDFLQSVRQVSEIPFILLTERNNREQLREQTGGHKNVYFTNSQEIGEVVKAVEAVLK